MNWIGSDRLPLPDLRFPPFVGQLIDCLWDLGLVEPPYVPTSGSVSGLHPRPGPSGSTPVSTLDRPVPYKPLTTVTRSVHKLSSQNDVCLPSRDSFGGRGQNGLPRSKSRDPGGDRPGRTFSLGSYRFRSEERLTPFTPRVYLFTPLVHKECESCALVKCCRFSPIDKWLFPRN